MPFNFQILSVLLLLFLHLGMGALNKTSNYHSQFKATKGAHPSISLEAVSPYLYMELMAGKSTPGYSGDNGPATSANLDARGVWTDSLRNIYITEQDNVRIRKVNVNGIITTIAGDGTLSTAGVGGQLASVRFFKPWSIVGDDAGFFVMILCMFGGTNLPPILRPSLHSRQHFRPDLVETEVQRLRPSYNSPMESGRRLAESCILRNLMAIELEKSQWVELLPLSWASPRLAFQAMVDPRHWLKLINREQSIWTRRV
jgi:hypothetical protein